MTCLETVKTMKQAIEKEGYKTRYMCQPLGYRTHGLGKTGFIELEELPLGRFSDMVNITDTVCYMRSSD